MAELPPEQTEDAAGPDEPKRPGLLKQSLPFIFAIGIIYWVFTGLTASVVNEMHTLGDAPSPLARARVLAESIEIRSADSRDLYCVQLETDAPGRCPNGADALLRPLEDNHWALQRTDSSRIDTGAIVAVSYQHNLSPSDLMQRLSEADLGLFLPAILLLLVVFFAADTFAFGRPYRRFLSPGISWGELAVVRGGPYLIQISLAMLAEILFPLYMKRVRGVPVLATVGSNAWTMFSDLAGIFTVLTPAVAYNIFIDPLVPAIGWPWLIACIAFWLAYGGYIVWVAVWQPGPAADPQGFRRVWRLAKPLDYLLAYLPRAILWTCFTAANITALWAVGIEPPLPLAMIGAVLVVLSIFMPIGVGGYGGPQLIAWFLFVEIGGAGDAEQAVLYSLLFSTAFTAGRAAIGLVLFWPFWAKVSRVGRS